MLVFIFIRNIGIKTLEKKFYTLKRGQTRDYFDTTASNWNTSAHRASW